MFELERPVAGLGWPHGGQWWCLNMAAGYTTTLLVDNLDRVSDGELKRMKLVRTINTKQKAA